MVGTRTAKPSSLPLSSGSTSPTAAAAPVLVGICDMVAERARRRSALGEHPDAITVHCQVVAVDLDLAGESAVHGVVARQVRIGLRVAQVVERDDLELPGALALVEGAQHVASDTPVTVDADLDSHALSPPAVGVSPARYYRP